MLAIALRSNVGVSYATIQAGPSSIAQNNSTGMVDLFGMLPVHNDAASAFPGNGSIFILLPKPITITDRVWIHAGVSGGSDGYFSATFYYE